MPVTVYGASDDLIEIEGDISEEFTYGLRHESSGAILAFSDGTVIRIHYGLADEAMWRIIPVRHGRLGPTDEPVGWSLRHATDEESNYSDVLTLNADIEWVVLGDNYVAAPKRKKRETGAAS